MITNILLADFQKLYSCLIRGFYIIFLSRILWTDECKFNKEWSAIFITYTIDKMKILMQKTQTNLEIKFGVNLWMKVKYILPNNPNGYCYWMFLQNNLFYLVWWHTTSKWNKHRISPLWMSNPLSWKCLRMNDMWLPNLSRWIGRRRNNPCFSERIFLTEKCM